MIGYVARRAAEPSSERGRRRRHLEKSEDLGSSRTDETGHRVLLLDRLAAEEGSRVSIAVRVMANS